MCIIGIIKQFSSIFISVVYDDYDGYFNLILKMCLFGWNLRRSRWSSHQQNIILIKVDQFRFEHIRVKNLSCICYSVLDFILSTNCNIKMKIKWFFVVVLLFVNFTLIECLRGVMSPPYRARQRLYTRRYFRNKYRSTPRKYFIVENGDAGNANKWVEPLPPISPDHPSMQQAKRLNYLASNKKGAKSNIGRLLSGR